MPKIKTRKSIQKRFHITGTGKIMHMHQGKSHLRMAKSKRVKRSYDEMTEMSPANRKRIMRLLPYDVK
ncbi:MAG: 50S ribosomal protein L35 [Chloroflexota bacterium]